MFNAEIISPDPHGKPASLEAGAVTFSGIPLALNNDLAKEFLVKNPNASTDSFRREIIIKSWPYGIVVKKDNIKDGDSSYAFPEYRAGQAYAAEVWLYHTSQPYEIGLIHKSDKQSPITVIDENSDGNTQAVDIKWKTVFGVDSYRVVIYEYNSKVMALDSLVKPDETSLASGFKAAKSVIYTVEVRTISRKARPSFSS